MTDNYAERETRRINRRTVLQTVGLLGASALGGVAAGQGQGGGQPCHKDFECEEGETYVKIEFVAEDEDGDGVIESDECSFVEETNTGLITIDSYTSKEDEVCEPISVEWSVADGYTANEVMAYGGEDCVTVEDPDPGNSFAPGLEGPGGQTAAISNLQFCVEEEDDTVELPADTYIGYEDRPKSGDFDYNDFGMRATISETYTDAELDTIEMEFSSVVHLADDSHLIHIEREFPSDVEYDYSISRSSSAEGGETPATSFSGSGTLDVTMFDTDFFTQDDTVSVSVTITDGSVSQPTTSPRPDVAADNPLFEVYDPYMMNETQGERIDLGTIQSGIDDDDTDDNDIRDKNTTTENWDNQADVPNIIVVPDVNFVVPDENTTITTDYPEFDDYYAGGTTDDGVIEVDATYDDWFDTS